MNVVEEMVRGISIIVEFVSVIVDLVEEIECVVVNGGKIIN